MIAGAVRNRSAVFVVASTSQGSKVLSPQAQGLFFQRLDCYVGMARPKVTNVFLADKKLRILRGQQTRKFAPAF